MIEEESPVRIIDAFIDAIDFKQASFDKSLPAERGRPPYDPADLLKLYIYGYMNRIRTSRKLERECTRNIELMWLMNNLRPSARSIAYFRSDNKKALKQVFRQFVVMKKKKCTRLSEKERIQLRLLKRLMNLFLLFLLQRNKISLT